MPVHEPPATCIACGGSAFSYREADPFGFQVQTVAGHAFRVSAPAWRCLRCGAGYTSDAVREAVEVAIARELWWSHAPTPETIRFSRKAVGLGISDFAGLCGVSTARAKLWEAGERKVSRRAELTLASRIGVAYHTGTVRVIVKPEVNLDDLGPPKEGQKRRVQLNFEPDQFVLFADLIARFAKSQPDLNEPMQRLVDSLESTLGQVRRAVEPAPSAGET